MSRPSYEKKYHLALSLMCAVFLCTGLQGAELHVSTDGNDSGPGTLNEPFATIIRARDEIRNILPTTQEDITVNIHGGTYYTEESILLDDRDSGNNGYYVIYKNYNDEVPVIIGGVPVSNWMSHKDGIMQAQVGKDLEFWALLANEKLAPMARDDQWGNNIPASLRNVQAYYQGSWMSEYLKVTAINENNQVESAFQQSQFTGGLNYLQGAVEFIDEPGEWAMDSDSGILYYLPENESDLNHIVRPTVKSIFSLRGRSPEQLVKNIRIEGLELLLTDFNANMRCYAGITENGYEYHGLDQPNTMRTALVTLENACSNVISKCNMHDAPLNAVALYEYAQENEISASRMDNLGYSGVYLAGPPIHKDRTEIINKANTVRNNLISNVMRAVNHASGIQIYQSAENLIEHNLIHTSRRYGISVKGARWGVFNTIGLGGVPFENYCDYVHSSRNIIRNNYMYDLGADSADGGGIECWGGGRDNVIDHNIIVDAYCGDPKSGWRGHSIFMDDGSNYWTIKNNIVWNTRVPSVNACCMIKGVDMNTFNNVFDISLCDHGTANLEWYVEKSENHDFSRNIIYSDDNRMTHDTGRIGPEIDPTRKAIRLKDASMISSMDHNVYFNKQGRLVFLEENGGYTRTLAEWSTSNNKFDAASSALDPNFINAEERDYRLKDSSIAFEMGIESIDTSNIGPLADYSFAPENDPLRTVFLKGNGQDIYIKAALNETISTHITGRTEGWFVADLSEASTTYSSSDPEIATVDTQGQVELKKKGRVVISATVNLNGTEKTDDLVIYSGQEKTYYTIHYLYDATKGRITGGNATQFVPEGKNTELVTAEPNFRYRFSGWSDGLTTAERSDIATSNLNITAYFEAASHERLEAEGSTLNGVVIESNTSCSGGYAVGYFDAIGDSLTFSVIECSGSLLIRYSNADSEKKVSVYTNGVHCQDVLFETTGSWATYTDQVINVDVSGSIKLQVDSDDKIYNGNYAAINVDYIEFTVDQGGNTGNQPPTIFSFSSDKKMVSGGETAMLSWNTSDADTLTLNPGSINTTVLTSSQVTVTSDTTYALIADNTYGSVTSLVSVSIDSDHDGMPDTWENEKSLNPFMANQGDDPDADGLTNYFEYMTDTLPMDGNSKQTFHFDMAEGPDDMRSIFSTSSNRYYVVEYCDEMGGSWTNLSEVFQGTGMETNIFDSSDEKHRFYRLRIKLSE